MDLRTERTKKSIIDAFIELRAQKPLEKITVKELAELAYINKATFYSHYHDIYDLSEQIENELISSVLKNIPHPDHLISEPRRAVYELTDALTSKSTLFHTIFSGSRAGLFAKKLEHELKKQIYSAHPEFENSLTADVLLSVLIQGCFYAFLSHSDNVSDDVTEILADINQCLKERFFP